jgi:hypothetical protein
VVGQADGEVRYRNAAAAAVGAYEAILPLADTGGTAPPTGVAVPAIGATHHLC